MTIGKSDSSRRVVIINGFLAGMAILCLFKVWVTQRPYLLTLGVFSALLWFTSLTVEAQFVNVTDQYSINQHTEGSSIFGHAMSVHDFNGDGLDDLSFGTTNQPPRFYLNTGDGFELLNLISASPQNTIKSILWVDIDNDGDKDLYISYEYNSVRLYENTGDLNLVDITLSSGIPMESDIRNYGASFGDYNNDGYLDLYQCKYHNNLIFEGPSYENRLYKNNGDNTFTNVTDSANANIGVNASFMATWFDFNNDGWQDIFVVNDRIFNRNHLLKNNGDGTFTEVAVDVGLEAYIDAMGCSLGDFNNDGLQDVFVANSQTMGNHLYRKMPDYTFNNIADSAGVQAYDLCWSGLWMDYDNNGWLDLHVGNELYDISVEPRNYFFVNNQDETFTEMGVELGLEFDNHSTFSTAQGDWNMDGYADFVSHGREGSPSKLWENDGSSNNYIAVTLEGVVSNRDAIGSTIYCYANNTVQMRYMACGENYIAQDSQRKIFGIGDQEFVDSLIVHWLSGQVDRFYNVSVNQTLHVVEGSGITVNLFIEGATTICDGDTTWLHAGNWESYLWNTGDTVPSIAVSQPGQYVVLVTQNGIQVASDTVTISMYPEPVILENVNHVLCHGDFSGSIELFNQSGTGTNLVQWYPKGMGSYLQDLAAGLYTYLYTDENGCNSEGTVVLEEPSPVFWNISLDTLKESCSGQWYGEVVAIGGTPPFTYDWVVSNLSTGEELLTINDQATWCLGGGEPVWVQMVLSDFNGCVETDGVLLGSLYPVAVYEREEKFSIHPNPSSSGVFHLVANFPIVGWEMIDLTGSTVALGENSRPDRNTKIDAGNCANGLYLLRLKSESGVWLTSKVVVGF